MENVLIDVICNGIKDTIYKHYLLTLPYYELYFDTKFGDNLNETVVNYDWTIFTKVLEFSVHGNIDLQTLDLELLEAISFYMMLEYDIEDIDNFTNNLNIMAISIKCETFKGRLYESQIKHLNNLMQIYRNYTCALDYSETGAGKTYTTCALASSLGCSLFVICEKSVIDKWETIAKLFNVNIIHIGTYASFSNKKCKHGYLIYNKNTKDYEYLTKLDDMLLCGVIVVIDECHKCKNNSYTTKSIITLSTRIHAANKIIKSNGWSRQSKLLAISASPIDKEEHILNITRVLGFTKTHKNWYYIDNGQQYLKLVRTGFNELFTYPEFRQVFSSESKYNMLMNDVYISKSYLTQYIIDFFYIMKPKISCSMDPRESKLNVSNIYLTATPDEEEEALRGYAIMEEAVNATLNNKIDLAGFNRGLVIVQRVKCYPMFRRALHNLRTNPKCKVVLFIPVLEMITRLYDAFMNEGYMPLRMTGCDSREDRSIMLSLFAENNDTYRIFLTNTKVSSTGIDLDDKFGDYPRICDIVPEDEFLKILQSCGRFDRIDTKSESNINIIYLEAIRGEQRLLESLNSKNKVVESVVNRTTHYSGII